MPKFAELALAAGIMLPFLCIYLFGVAVKRCQDNVKRAPKPIPFIQVAGEAVPGAIELIGTLALVFGALMKSDGEQSSFQALGVLASASYLAFRGGYTYKSSLLDIARGGDKRSARDVSA